MNTDFSMAGQFENMKHRFTQLNKLNGLSQLMKSGAASKNDLANLDKIMNEG
jgi:hypothetical protein